MPRLAFESFDRMPCFGHFDGLQVGVCAEEEEFLSKVDDFVGWSQV